MLFYNYLQFLSLLAYSWAMPLERRSINGPVIRSNFPDPSFIKHGNTYYAFSTTNGNGIPYATSTDFNLWNVSETPAMTRAGSWSNNRDLWAPDVSQIGNQFVMYYSAQKQSNGKHCIGVATSSTPAGTYHGLDSPLVCDDERGGAIDAFGYTDVDGSNWVIYKVDGNSIGHGGTCNNGVEPFVSTPIMAQRLSECGTTTDGSAPVQILDRDNGDGPLVEAPAILRVPTGNSALYFLFFSSGCYAESTYDTSYAVSRKGLLGPYVKARGDQGAPILRTGYPRQSLYAPGALTTGVKGDTKVLFHADLGTTANTRQMYSGILSINAEAGTVSLA